jgi:tRNA nucleotidyltransferase/poly(A) polymerase
MIQLDTTPILSRKNAFLVGGSLRDLLLGRTPLDYDVAVKGNPSLYAAKIAKKQNGHVVPLGKPGKNIFRVIAKQATVDVSAVKGASIEEDLALRDFTVNAMALDTVSGELIDIFGGMDDLKNRRIRMVCDAVFRHDPIRLLRAFRLSAILNFTMDAVTLAGIIKGGASIQTAAGERIRDELMKILAIPSAAPCIRQMAEAGLLCELFPEMDALRSLKKNRHHAFDGLEHTLRALSRLEELLANPAALCPEHAGRIKRRLQQSNPAILKCALLWHDIGKPVCAVRDASGILRTTGHENTGAAMAQTIAARLRFSNREIHAVDGIIRHHLRPLSLFIAGRRGMLTNRGVTRFFMKCEPLVVPILLHATADTAAKKTDPAAGEVRQFRQFAASLLRQYYVRHLPARSKAPLLTGHDLTSRLHLKPSPLFKTILSRVETARLSGEIDNKLDALALAEQIADREIGPQGGFETIS